MSTQEQIDSEAGSDGQHNEILIYPHADLLRRLPQMCDELPLELRPAFFEFLDASVTALNVRDEFNEAQAIEPICNGACRERDGELGARNFLYGIADPNEQDFLEHPLTCEPGTEFHTAVQLVQRLDDNLDTTVHAALLWDAPTARGSVREDMTVSDAILQRVKSQEHAGHRVGQRMTRRAGFSSAKLMFFRVVMMLEIANMVQRANALIDHAQGCTPIYNADGIDSGICSENVAWDRKLQQWFVKYTVPLDSQVKSCVFYNSTCIPTDDNESYNYSFVCNYNLRDCQLQVYGGKLGNVLQNVAGRVYELFLTCVSMLAFLAFLILTVFLNLSFAMGLLVTISIKYQLSLIVSPVVGYFYDDSETMNRDIELHDPATVTRRHLLYAVAYIMASLVYLFILSRVLSMAINKLWKLAAKLKRTVMRIRSNVQIFQGNVEPAIGKMTFSNILNLNNRATLIQPEMAQKGSQFCNMIVNTALLSICSRSVKGEFSHVGFAFRHRDYLITAMHVVEIVLNQNVDLYLLPCTEKDGCTVVDASRMVSWKPSYEANIVPDDSDNGINISSMYDCYIENVGNKFFSILGVSSLKISRSTFNCNARAFGYFQPDVKSAMGVICKTDEEGFVHYTASTRDGSSGCPIVSGSGFYALHLGVADNGKNRGLSAALIEMFIYNHEKITIESTPDFRVDRKSGTVRDKAGRAVEFRDHGVGGTIYDPRTGYEYALRPSHYERIIKEERHIDIGKGYRVNEASNLVVDTNVELDVRYDDDCTTSPLVKPCLPPSPHKRLLKITDNSLLVVSKHCRKAVTPPTFNGYDSKSESVLDLDLAEDIGYDRNLFAFPQSSNPSAMVAESFMKHVEVFVSAAKTALIPDLDIQNQAYRIVMKQLAGVTYLLPTDPMSDESIKSVMHSSLIKNNKSPGRRFMVDGLMSNEAVFARYTDEELIAMVRAEEPPQDINVFPKLDPHKKSKIDDGMIRCISGVDLIEQIRAHVYFNALNTSIASNWKKSPVKVGFSPIQPKSGEFFYNLFTGSGKKYKWVEDDTSTWDWRCLEFVIKLVCKIAVQLGKRPARMSEEEAEKIREQAYAIAIRQFMFPFVLPDGTVVERLRPNIMTSGSVITLIFNSIAMLVLDAIAKLKMGYSADDILSLFILCVGGDDKLQRAPIDFDHEKYVSNLNEMGLKIHEAKVRDTVDGIEFFSWRFQRGSNRAREITWIPTRFAKHVHNLRATPYKDLKDALISHAYNWVHDKEKFEYFRTVFENASALTPELFDLRKFPDRQQLINYFYGFESSSPILHDLIVRI